jgi:PilZ domain
MEMDIPYQDHHSASGAERRGWDRLPISIPFFMRGKTFTGEEFLEFTFALNLSAGGVLLTTKRHVEPNTQILLEVPIALVHKAQLPHSISVLNATILRCRPEHQYFLLGVQFDKPLIAAPSGSGGDSVAPNL